MYGYNAQGNCSTILTPVYLVLMWQISGPTIFYATTALPTDATATTSPHILRARLINTVAAMPQDVDNQMKTAQQRYRGDGPKEYLKCTADV